MNGTPKTCTVEGCDAASRAKGMCQKHYTRQRKTGTTDPRPTLTVEQRFWSKVNKTSTCWLWTGTLAEGYGSFYAVNSNMPAHRFAWEELRGEIPEGLVLDHVCRVHRCVNPAHLEPVTNGENVLRGIGPAAINKRKTHCQNGHVLTPRKGYPRQRECRPCIADIDRERSQQMKQLRRERRSAKFVLAAKANAE
jgi:hypothetical protein